MYNGMWDVMIVIVGCLKLDYLSGCYSVNSEDGMANRTQNGTCTLNQVIYTKFTKAFFKTDTATPTLSISEVLNCTALPSDPSIASLFLQCNNTVRCFSNLPSHRSYLHVRKRQSNRDIEVICLLHVRSNLKPKHHESDMAVSEIWDHMLPCSRTLKKFYCKICNSHFYCSTGRLFVMDLLCLKHNMLFKLDLHCNWCVSSGKYRKSNSFSVQLLVHVGSFEEYWEELLGGKSQSEAGKVSRRKRSVNTSPQFQRPVYQVSVPENMPSGTPIVLLTAVDTDMGEAGRLEYFIEALFDSRSDSLFVVDPFSGAVSTAEVLDWETRITHTFQVTALDHGKPPRTAMATLTITVSDINDHDPVFEQRDYKESIRENLEIGYEVLTVRATDRDSPRNANIVYRLLNGNVFHGAFEIDPRSGVIRTLGPVDREEVEAYNLLVEANDQGKDPGPRSSMATVHISVEDDNDNAPQFSKKHYVVQVPEDMSPDTEILQLSATDRDQGSNAVVHFSIMSGNGRGQFYVDTLTGKMELVGQLDYEANKEYTLRVRAQDGGRPPLYNISGLVTVQVLDVNDNAPIFVSSPFQAAVLENAPLGYSIIHIQAIDADSRENSQLEYRLIETGPGFPFSINNSTGWVSVAAELDRETVEFYSFSVEACDHGSPPMATNAYVSVTILDVNDNDPKFSQTLYYTRLNEDAAVGTSVVTVLATDLDTNNVVTYQISSGNTRNRFTIGTQSNGAGLITLTMPLDYKLERQFLLTVSASDGTRSDTAQVIVNVTDANTHRPVFLNSHYTANIDEDCPLGTTIVVISAMDEDTGENAHVSYFMEDSIPQFNINPESGVVVTRMELDYEDQVSYTLAITAQDNGIPKKSDTTYLEILVNDVNDNSPQFLHDRYQGFVFEDVPIFTSVLQVSATDQDSGQNGHIFYTFLGGEDGDGDFAIESTSGIVRSQQRLDRENVALYNLRAFAVDKGLPALKTGIDIQVAILDVNDNPPLFEEDEFDILVEENSPIGLVIAHLTASDPDDGSNAQVMYQIVEGNIPEVFQLDIFSGELTALTDLDYEAHTEYVVVVQATSTPLVSRATVHIKLIDKNDNPPTLSNFQIIFNHYVTTGPSTFPTGVIGRVPAHDPDVLDQLHYMFEFGNELNLVLLNQSTGELRLNRELDNNRPLDVAMRISVSDGLHMVSAHCLLRVAIVTDKMLANSVTLRLADTSQQHFLSLQLDHFLEGVAHVLSVAQDEIVVFDVQDDTDVSARVLNVSLTVAALPLGARQHRGQFLSSEELQERLYLNRSLLGHLSSQRVLPFDDNVCLHEPCQSYMRCISVLHFDSLVPFVASDTVLFRPIRPVKGLRCLCPLGFTGDFCETKVDLCHSRPCGNHGVCHSHEGGYICECLQSYTGERCELSSRSDRCAPGVCQNGGTCINLLVGGFRCECPPGDFEKPYCQMSTRSFPPQSFLTLKGLRQRFHFTLSLTFATQQRNGLLFYNGRFNQKHDFVAMEIVNEQIVLTFSAGEITTLVSPFTPEGVSDSKWHKVQVHYYNKPILNSGGHSEGPSDQKVLVVTVDNCDTSVALKFGHMLRNYSCAAQGIQSGFKKALDLTGPLLLGGVPQLPEDFPVQNQEFVGCMKNLQIDHRPIDLGSYIANNGTIPGCSAKKHFCGHNPCLNGGTCMNRWHSFHCDCPLGFGGWKCEREVIGPQLFQGSGIAQWSNITSVTRVPRFAEMMFRTWQATGTLFSIEGEQHHSLTVQLREGDVELLLQRGGAFTLSQLGVTRVNNGQWHHLQLELHSERAVASGLDAILSLDYGLSKVSMKVDSKLLVLKLKTLSLGAVPGEDGTVQHGFHGCVQGLQVGDSSSSAVPLSLAQARRVNVEQGCHQPSPCESNPCPPNSDCNNAWDSYSCTCHPGYYGNSCTDVCSLNPCEHQSVCTRKPSSFYGYTCDCPSNYFGQYCEKKVDLPCPQGWWGPNTCMPCSCPVEKGFESDCNKSSGACRCKENHYELAGSDSCLPCDCYPMGSLSRACDGESGQCQCRPGVMGRQCDHCDIPFAEVSPGGCEVIYHSCPRAIQAGIWWPRTGFGFSAAAPCPKGSIGTAVRHCDRHKSWLDPDLLNCTSLTFAKLTAVLTQNESLLDSGQAWQVASMLCEASQLTLPLRSGDVALACRLAGRLLQHKPSTRDVYFTENLVQVGSAILALETRPHWKLIQQREGGSAFLLNRYEAYASWLVENMRKTYLSPFTVITPNIACGRLVQNMWRTYPSPFTIVAPNISEVISLDHLEKMNFADVKVLRHEVLQRAVDMEADGFKLDKVSSSDNHSVDREEVVASVLIFHSLAALLPEHYDPDRRSMRVPRRPTINTPVVSIAVHSNQESSQHVQDHLITVQFRLVQPKGHSKPTCVFWNHSILSSEGIGGWSAKGCELVYRNHSHISCRCCHMTGLAVLMDISPRENADILPLKLLTWSTVAVTLAFLLLTTLSLSCLHAVHSNQSSISRHGAAALFLSELLFIFGINQVDSPFLCTVIAILLQYIYTCSFTWLFLEGLHIHRTLSEVRSVSYGPMYFYHFIGWGVPAIITGLAVGLNTEGYTNSDFCWLSMYDALIWSFAGPAVLAVSMSIFLNIKVYCSLHHYSLEKRKSLASGLKTAFGALLLVTASCLSALVSVNTDSVIFHYLFAGLNCVQGPFIFFSRVVLNKEVKSAICRPCRQKRGDVVGSKTLASSRTCSSPFVSSRLYPPLYGDSGVSLNYTLPSGRSQHSYLPFVLREDPSLYGSQDHITLSDQNSLLCEAMEPIGGMNSDLSLEDGQSGSCMSTHSSDSMEEGPYLLEHMVKQPLPHMSLKDMPQWPEAFASRANEGAGSLLDEGPDLEGEGPGRGNMLLYLQTVCSQRGILKKKPLSPIVERYHVGHCHNELSVSAPGSDSSQGSSSN